MGNFGPVSLSNGSTATSLSVLNHSSSSPAGIWVALQPPLPPLLPRPDDGGVLPLLLLPEDGAGELFSVTGGSGEGS